MNIEAMKLALEALEFIPESGSMLGVQAEAKRIQSITALRQAIDTATQIKQAQPSQRDIKQSASVEPAAMRYDFDGYGYKYIDSGSGSDWQTRIKDAEPMFASPPQHALMAEHWKEQYEQMKAQSQPITDDEIKRLIIEGATKFECLGDWCILAEYDPDIGRIPPQWKPTYDVFQATRYVIHAAHGITGEKE